MQDVLQKYEADLKTVEDRIKSYFYSEIALIPEISDHLISSGGKRLRPLLLLMAADLCGYRGERRFPFSAVIEFIHTASLLHDDVVDHADTRRGKPSANHVWGNSASVLVGDFLYSKSFKLMADEGDIAIVQLMSTISNQMSEGEVFQLVKCGDLEMTEEDYFFLIQKKTAILISAACSIGAILAGVNGNSIAALGNYGTKIGTAFQLTDDTLDYIAEEEEFGKAIGMDLKEGKITLPLIHALRNCSKNEKKLIKSAVLNKNLQSGETREILGLIQKYKGIEYSLQKAGSLVTEAKAILDIFPDSEAKQCLLAVSDFVRERKL
ncbi:MAG: polyprenyl synthetase family protein [Syntrophaceae bacterium]